MIQNNLFPIIGVVGKISTRLVVDTIVRLVPLLQSHGATLLVEQSTAEVLPISMTTCSLAEMVDRVSLIIVVGGDGSLLSVARSVAGKPVPVVGVNRGGLGFLADIRPDELESGIEAVLSGHYQKEQHFLLGVKVMRQGKQVHSSLALNDAVVHAGTLSQMMLFNLTIDGELVYSQRSEGLIIATPTGSTAYALSAGGPILHPDLNAIVLVPMFPHALTSRPIVVGGASRIEVAVAESHAKPQVSCDSQVDFALQVDDKVCVQRQQAITLLHLKDHGFYQSCRNKLDWASRLGS